MTFVFSLWFLNIFWQILFVRMLLALLIGLILYNSKNFLFFQFSNVHSQLTYFHSLVWLFWMNKLCSDPLFVIEYLTSGWFIVFLGSLCELLFTCILFLFWFFIVDKLRLVNSSSSYQTKHKPNVNNFEKILFSIKSFDFE